MIALPDRRAWLFSAKTFTAAMLALYVSLRLDLPRPYWAVATCYIVAQPWSGMARAKGLYRLLGTLAGGVAAVALIPNLVSAPPLLIAAMALWIALCVVAAMLTRMPQNYAFMLAGYTTAIIGFPTLDQPETIFATTVARCTEIGIGIVCMLVMESVFPVQSANHVLAKLNESLADLSRLACDTLTGGATAARVHAERRRVAGDGIALGALVDHLRYEPSSGRGVRDWLPVVHRRIRALPLLLANAADHLAALRAAEPAAAEAMAPLMRIVADWFARSAAAPKEALAQSEMILARIDAARPDDGARQWPALLSAGLLGQMRRLVIAWGDGLAARSAIDTAARPSREDRQAAAVWPPAHADGALVALSGLSAFATVAGICALWIATEWPDGATAAMMAAFGVTLFVQVDEPGRPAGRFVWAALSSLLLAGVYSFGVLPALTDFVPLVLALALLFLPMGAALGMPSLAGWAMPVMVFTPTLLGLTSHFSADLAGLLGGGIAVTAGLAMAYAGIRIVRPMETAWRTRRLIAADRRDLIAAARGTGRDGPELVATMLDRFDAIAATLPTTVATALGTAAELRIAPHVAELRALRRSVDDRTGLRIDRTLRHLGRHFERPVDAPPSPALLAALDSTLAATAHQPRVALALAGLRCALSPDAKAPAAFTASRGLAA